MVHLIEPYNAYQKPQKKKHPTEILEEELLYFRMLHEAEQRRQTEYLAEQSALKQSQNLALMLQLPQPPSQQVQNGQYSPAAGAGGWVSGVTSEFTEVLSFNVSPLSGVGPLSVSFVNTTPTPGNDTFLWLFGSGSLTSTAVTPNPLVYTQTGSYTITLQETSSQGNFSVGKQTITVNSPSVTVSFLEQNSSVTNHRFTGSFTSSVIYNGSGTVAGSWIFGDGTTLAYTNDNPFTHSYVTSSGVLYTASLSVTESSYNLQAAANKISFSVSG